MFSIEFSGRLFVLLRPSVFSFSFGCSSAKSLYLCDILRFFQWQQLAGAPVFFFWIFSDFFLSFLPKITAEKEPKRYMPGCRCTMELPQPKGNDREKKYKKREPWTGSKSPYKILYMLFIQNNFVCPLEAKVVCPLTKEFKIFTCQL